MRSLLRVFNQQPLAAKVPEVTALFWVIKISTTAAGEAISDMFVSNKELGFVVEVSMFCVALVLQFRVAPLLGRHVLVPGAGDRDGRHRRRRHHAPRARPALRRDLAVLAGGAGRGLLPLEPQRAHARHPLHHDQPAGEVLLVRRLRHLRARARRSGDFAATTLGLGYLASALLFCGVILIPWVGWKFLRWNSIFAFWFAYVITRPIGASFADYFSKRHDLSGAQLRRLADRARVDLLVVGPGGLHGAWPATTSSRRTRRSPAAPDRRPRAAGSGPGGHGVPRSHRGP